MSPFIAYHATSRRHRAGIRKHGLIAGRDNRSRPFGVYVYNDDCLHHGQGRPNRGTPTFPFDAMWSAEYGQDVWRVAYIGPLRPDRYIRNGWVLESIPPQHLQLITHLAPSSA